MIEESQPRGKAVEAGAEVGPLLARRARGERPPGDGAALTALAASMRRGGRPHLWMLCGCRGGPDAGTSPGYATRAVGRGRAVLTSLPTGSGEDGASARRDHAPDCALWAPAAEPGPARLRKPWDEDAPMGLDGTSATADVSEREEGPAGEDAGSRERRMRGGGSEDAMPRLGRVLVTVLGRAGWTTARGTATEEAERGRGGGDGIAEALLVRAGRLRPTGGPGRIGGCAGFAVPGRGGLRGALHDVTREGTHGLVFAVLPWASADALGSWDVDGGGEDGDPDEPVPCREVSVFGQAEASAARGPYVALIHARRVRGTAWADAAYLHPCWRCDRPVPVDSGNERLAMTMAAAFVDECRRQRVPGAGRMRLDKPCVDARGELAPHSDPGRGPLVPDLLLRLPGGRRTVVEVMGYDGRDYRERKERMASDLREAGVDWIEADATRPEREWAAGLEGDLNRLGRRLTPGWVDAGLVPAGGREASGDARPGRTGRVGLAGIRMRRLRTSAGAAGGTAPARGRGADAAAGPPALPGVPTRGGGPRTGDGNGARGRDPDGGYPGEPRWVRVMLDVVLGLVRRLLRRPPD